MKYFIFCISIVVFWGCQPQSDIPLQLASTAAIVEMHKTGQFDVEHALFLKENGREIDADDVKRIKDGTYSCDYFIDNKGVIREAKVRPTAYEDRIRYILIKNADYDPKYRTPLLRINCDSLPYNIKEIYRTHLEDWPDEIPNKDTLGFFDFERAKIVSIDENCVKSSADVIQTFWSMVHHNDREVIAYYYLDLKQWVEEGLLREGVFALTTDRLLSWYNYPQVFGSQIINGQLQPIEHPNSVDVRRADVGLEPLNEYLSVHFGMSWPLDEKSTNSLKD